MDEFGWRTIARPSDSQPGLWRRSIESLAVTAPALRSGTESPLDTRAATEPSLWTLQIVMCSTAARASGLPLRPDVHNAAEPDRSADSGHARQPMCSPRPSQPCSFCGRRSGALSGRRLSRIHVPDGYVSIPTPQPALVSKVRSDS